MLVLRSLHQGSRTCDFADLMSASDRIGYDGPRGATSMQHGVCTHEIYLARADGLDFDVLQQLDTRQR